MSLVICFFFGGKSPLTRSLLSMVLHLLRRGAREDRHTMGNAKKSSCSSSTIVCISIPRIPRESPTTHHDGRVGDVFCFSVDEVPLKTSA